MGRTQGRVKLNQIIYDIASRLPAGFFNAAGWKQGKRKVMNGPRRLIILTTTGGEEPIYS